jgi:hypothetical protein
MEGRMVMDRLKPRFAELNLLLITSLTLFYVLLSSRDSPIDIVTGYGLDNRGVEVPSIGKIKNFLFTTSSRPALGSTQPPIQWE